MSKFNWSNPPYKIKKDGTQSKVHDRSVYRTAGNEVELAYGTFTVLEAEKIDKVWYVTLKDVNETFKIKQQQMGNKKLPKTRVIIAHTQPVIAGLLPAPKELIDQILEQANTCIKLYNNTVTDSNLLEPTWEQTIEQCNPVWVEDPVNLFKVKIQVIAGGVACGLPNAMSIYRQLVQYYHPDHNNSSYTELFELIGEFRHMI